MNAACAISLACLLATPALALAEGPGACAPADPAPAADMPTLDVRLTAASGIPPAVARAVRREAEAIWCREGVRLRWDATADPSVSAPSVLRVLVVSWALPGDRPDDPWAVGELLNAGGGQPLALASADAARRVMAAARTAGDPPALVDYRLGVVLGRAVAHEIGHYLLGPTHAPRGLMRANVPASEFADLRVGAFSIDAVTARQARAAASLRRAAPGSTAAPGS